MTVWSLAIAALAIGHASAQGDSLRFGCSQLVIERSDPIVSPGMNPSPHTHQIVGGNSFNFTMDPADHDPAKASTCTSCTYSEDFSNYWTATVYFKSPENGTYRLVPQMANFNSFDGKKFLQQEGGLTVYYMQPFSGSAKVTAFKPVRLLPAIFQTQQAPLSSSPSLTHPFCHRASVCSPVTPPCAPRPAPPPESATAATATATASPLATPRTLPNSPSRCAPAGSARP